MAQPAGLALDGGDPRLQPNRSEPTTKRLHDPSVTFEEYVYYAKIERQREKALPDALRQTRPFKSVFGKKKIAAIKSPTTAAIEQKETKEGVPPPAEVGIVPEEEWYQAARALRTATWGAVFYLITTDVLGPYSVPWALSQMGYGPGISLYTVFGALAGYTGWQIWRMFLRLDSVVYPLKSFGDIAFRVYVPWARHFVNFLQTLQLIFTVGLIVLQNGQGLYQINSKICYVACCLIWTSLGIVLGQIRTLQKFGWIANLAVWINISVMILTVVVVSRKEVIFEMAAAR